MHAKHFLRLALVGAAALLPPNLFAQDKPAEKRPEELFQELDKNKDGKLTPDEVSDDRKRFFEHLVRVGDKDKDGSLTRDEFAQGLKPDETPALPPQNFGGSPGGPRGPIDPRQQFERMDQNKDGKVSVDEVPDFMRPQFQRALEQLGKKEMTPEEFGRFTANSRQGMPGGGPDEMFQRFDGNKDGKLTMDELPEPLKDRFRPVFERLGKKELSKDEYAEYARRVFGQPGQPGQPPGGQFSNPEELFKRLDQNGDGKLTLAEAGDRARPMVEGVLRRLNKGEDGSLSQEEFARAMAQGRPGDGRPEGAPRPEGMRPGEGGQPGFFMKLDANRDGRLSKDELKNLANVFDELDTNKDGNLDPREVFGGRPEGGPPGAPPNRRPEGGQPGAPPNGRPARPESANATPTPAEKPAITPNPLPEKPAVPPPARPQAKAVPQGEADQMFARADKNGDGKLSKDEAPDRLKDNFARIDSNGDGFISAEEFKPIASRLGERKKKKAN